MRCKKCGADLGKDPWFCTKCGQLVSTKASTSKESTLPGCTCLGCAVCLPVALFLGLFVTITITVFTGGSLDFSITFWISTAVVAFVMLSIWQWIAEENRKMEKEMEKEHEYIRKRPLLAVADIVLKVGKFVGFVIGGETTGKLVSGLSDLGDNQLRKHVQKSISENEEP